MTGEVAGRRDGIRYQPDERPPLSLAIGLGLQTAMISIVGIVLVPVLVTRASNIGEPYVSWAVFCALAVSGLTTILQAARVGRLGAGHIVLMGSSGAFIAVSVAALTAGGPALLATLVVSCALFQLALAPRISWFRRVLTPAVCGTIVMLISVNVMPIAFALLDEAPPGTHPAAAPVCLAVALLSIAGILLRGSTAVRPWAPLVGVVAGSLTGLLVGLYQFELVLAAEWMAVPVSGWPGFDVGFGAAFWGLLPAFWFVMLVTSAKTIGESVAIQSVSWREPRAPDYRVVQGTITAGGAGNLLCGIAGTVPNMPYSASASVIEMTGVAARRVGIWVGLILCGFAFIPKAVAILQAIPGAVVGAYLIALFGVLFTVGMQVVARDGMDVRKAVIVGLSFWIGVGFQEGAILADQLTGPWATLFANGVTAGGLTAIALTLFLDFTGARSEQLAAALDPSAGPKIEAFLRRLAARHGWSDRAQDRLAAAGEEALLTLAQQDPAVRDQGSPRLRLNARTDRRGAELEFVATPTDANIEDQLALVEQGTVTPEESDLSLRLLQHYASSVRHQKYHGLDIVTVKVEATR